MSAAADGASGGKAAAERMVVPVPAAIPAASTDADADDEAGADGSADSRRAGSSVSDQQAARHKGRKRRTPECARRAICPHRSKIQVRVCSVIRLELDFHSRLTLIMTA